MGKVQDAFDACGPARDEDGCTVTQRTYEALRKQNEKMKEVLQWIGYPKRGSDSEAWDIQDAANHIQNNFTREELDLDA